MQTTKMLSTKAFEQWLNELSVIISKYRQIEKGELLAEYNTLMQVVQSADFKSKKHELTTTRYADTKEGKTMIQYNQLKWKMSVILYNMLKKEAWKNKPEVAEFLQLKAQVCTPEFQQAHAFWKNSKRWFTTPESQQEKRFNILAKHADIIFYQQYTEEKIAALESYKAVWKEEFDNTSLSNTWQTGFLYPTSDFKANHSHVNEQQAYMQGANTKVTRSVMSILTRKQQTTAPAWHPAKGMIMCPFAYTSDVWHTTEAIAPKTGVLQAKVRCKTNAKHVLCLTNKKAQHALAILPAQPLGEYAIYTLVWNEKEVVNYINNSEVARTKNPLPGEELHLIIRSYLPENQKAGKSQLDIDWIRIYTNA